MDRKRNSDGYGDDYEDYDDVPLIEEEDDSGEALS